MNIIKKENKKKILASILSADFCELGKEIDDVLQFGVDMIHFDVMDYQYVPNLTIGPIVCSSIRKHSKETIIDVHLMTYNIDDIVERFAESGANYISFHIEANRHIDRSIRLIRQLGCIPGVAINPSTDIRSIEYILEIVDYILIMSVNPGFGGQKFIEYTLKKISLLKELIERSGRNIYISVDGGLNIENIERVSNSGADWFVFGSSLFHSNDREIFIGKTREILNY